jgi:3-dehydroquinate synthase
MDALIEQRLGMPIQDVFAAHGEGFFREQERQLCQELAGRRGLVIATGGGTLVPEENRRVLGTGGLLVCLTCEVDELVRRLLKVPAPLGWQVEDRPLLALPDRRQGIKSLLAERREAYQRIPYQIDTTKLTVEEVGERVLELLKGETAMEKIPVRTPPRGYEVHIGRGLLTCVGELARQRGLRGKAALVTNPTVGSLYGPAVIESLQNAGFQPLVIQVPDGEAFKTLDTVRFLYDHFVSGAIDRASTVFALGGGVVGDTAGFAAATYMRGVPLAQLPTTLLAMVDASVGGKVAVDHPRGKNLIGAFHQPELVLVDPDVLSTLPEEDFKAGLAEVIKAGVIGSATLFEHLEHKGLAPVRWVIGEAIRVKVGVVEEDPYEKGHRAVLNLGHTFGHAMEVLSGFSLRHGEAVAVGMAIAVELAVELGLCDRAVKERLIAILQRFGLPTSYKGYEPGEILAAMATDKKRREAKLCFVLPRAIGEVVVADDVPTRLVLEVLERMKER